MKADDDPTPEELREAEALARALEGDKSAAPPPDVSAAAGLLRYARGNDLPPDRAEAIRGPLGKTVVPSQRRPRWWLWLLPPLAAATTAGVLLSPLRRPSSLSTSPATPSSALLAAQAAAARGDSQALDALDQHMRAYRQSMLRQLTRRRQ
jgi:hypothetical protein